MLSCLDRLLAATSMHAAFLRRHALRAAEVLCQALPVSPSPFPPDPSQADLELVSHLASAASLLPTSVSAIVSTRVTRDCRGGTCRLYRLLMPQTLSDMSALHCAQQSGRRGEAGAGAPHAGLAERPQDGPAEEAAGPLQPAAAGGDGAPRAPPQAEAAVLRRRPVCRPLRGARYSELCAQSIMRIAK